MGAMRLFLFFNFDLVPPCSIGAPKIGTRGNIVGMFNKRKEFNYGLQDTEIYRYGKVPH